MAAEQIEAMLAVHQAAIGLTLACTEYVGPMSMALSLPTVPTLAEPLSRQMRRDVSKIEKRGKKP